MYYVYWIHLINSNIKTDGYIGVTYNCNHRWSTHKKNAKYEYGQCAILEHAIRKYGDTLIYDIVYQGDKKSCLSFEKELRSTSHIGWNISIGGGSTMLGRKHTKETIDKLKKHLHSDSAKHKMSLARKGVPKSKEHRDAISSALSGKIRSKSHSEAISKSKSGKKCPLLQKGVVAVTGEKFLSITDAGKWAGTNRSSIRKCINGKQISAGRHPITHEKLTWANM